MLRNKLYLIFILSVLTVNLQALETKYINTYSKLIANNFKLVNLDDKNAEFKMAKKEEKFDYALKYKLSKSGYENSDYINSHTENFYNEDSYNVVFNSSIYLYDYMWLNFDMNYKDSLRSIMESSGGIAYLKKSSKEESIVELYFKPNSIITLSIAFENINNSIDYDKFINQSFKNTDNKKFSLNIVSDLDFITLNTSIFQIFKNNRYLLSSQSDDYLENTEELYRGLEISLSKELNKDLKVTTSAKFSNIEILNSNVDDYSGNTPLYTPQKEFDLKAEYFYNDIKFISKVTYVGSRYIDNLNSDKLGSYTIGSLGASFYTKFLNEDAKIDLSIKNILNKDYYLYSDIKGDSTNFMMNMTLPF